MEQTLKISIVGCGLIGQKRAKALGNYSLKYCVDIDENRAYSLANFYPGSIATKNWKKAVSDPEIGLVIVSTTNQSLAEISCEAARFGKHILVEKPAGRNTNEISEIIKFSEENQVQVRVGFNHRYHPAMLKAKELFDAGELGDLMFIRGRYGHGGRLGYDREWRANPKTSGGGELLDQGVHLIDLSRWFLGDFEVVNGFSHTYYWDMPVDDNGFMTLRTKKNQVAFLHVSCTEWKNLFSLEIYGKNAKLHIEGLGGSYGIEKLSFYKMTPQMGPPETIIWEYPRGDNSWLLEFNEFLDDIKNSRLPSANLYDALAAVKIVETISQESGYDYNS
ncbi:MAG: Gfo/Idh/MocA family oxidoreductase [Anaerolineaceae bacterium]|nr:Gfo/Idh/MocA family oxidoreductase [Anaerolineaceae bacterium]